jgi:flagellar motility protein MotE (MotC chaperone)
MPEKQQKADWAKILKDTKNYSDEMAIPLADGSTMLLGDIRAYNAATENSVQKQLQDIAQREHSTKVAETTVAQNYLTLEQQRKDFEQQKALWEQQFKQGKPPRENRDAIEDVLESDPVYQRLSKSQKDILDKFDQYQKAMDERLQKINETFNTMGSTYLGDTYQRTTADIKARNDPWAPKDMTAETLYKYAADNRIARPNGILDLNRAYDQMTTPARLEYETKQAYDKGKTDALKERDAAAMMPRPGGAFDIPGLDNARLDKLMNGVQRAKTLDEAFAAASRDPSMFHAGEV